MTTAPASLPQPDDKGVFYVIDLSGYVFRAYHAIAPLSSSKGEPTHAVMGTVNMIQKVVRDRKPHRIAIAMDSKGPTFRHDLDARYKAHRPPPPPDLSQQMQRCEAIARAYNFTIYQRDGVEADDLIACLVQRGVAAGWRVVIVSADKDLMQLLSDDDDQVVLWDSMRDKVYGPREVRQKFGVPPSRVRDLLSLMGDSSDNIPGVPGVGPKTASDLLTEYGTLDSIYEHVGAIKKTKLRENLIAFERDARSSRELVTLKCDLEIDWDPEALLWRSPKTEALRELFIELELHRLLDQVETGAQVVRSARCILDAEALRGLMAEAKVLKRIAFDTETTGLDATRAALIGLSLAVRPGEGYYVPVALRYLGAPLTIPWTTIREIIEPVMADPEIRKVAHHFKYDAIVLERHGVPIVGEAFDTMIASYLLDPETPNGLKDLAQRELNITMTSYDEVTHKHRGSQLPFDEVPCDEATRYAAADAEVCLTLHDRFAPRLDNDGLGSLFRDVEMPLARVLADMEQVGVLVDVAQLQTLGRRVEDDLRKLEVHAKELAGRDFSLRSRDQLEVILFDHLKLPVLKRTPKGGRSTDAEVLEELADKHLLPKLLVEYRELDKLKGTYIDALPRAVNPATGRIHSRFGQTTAATGRLSSSDPNLQNIPIRTELGRVLRSAFVAPADHVILSADYSQIELRILAHLSGDADLIDAFTTGEDVHARTAMRVFNVDRAAMTDEMRRRAKTINFGVIYGMGDAALGKSLGIPREEAARFIEAYFERYAGVARFLEQTVEIARRGDAVRTILGRRRFLPSLHSANRGLRLEAERIAKNTPIQGTAADILKVAMVKIGSAFKSSDVRMVLTVHDELVFEVPAARVEAVGNQIREAMESAMPLQVPLVVGIGSGPNWSSAH